jgi:hypothetical protein
VLTSEELRVAALEASAKRSKTVARRRLIRRWFMWFSWRYVLPVIGLVTLVAAMVGFARWQYLGLHEQFGSDNVANAAPRRANQASFDTSPTPKPQLKIDRNFSKNVTIKIDNDKEESK